MILSFLSAFLSHCGPLSRKPPRQQGTSSVFPSTSRCFPHHVLLPVVQLLHVSRTQNSNISAVRFGFEPQTVMTHQCQRPTCASGPRVSTQDWVGFYYGSKGNLVASDASQEVLTQRRRRLLQLLYQNPPMPRGTTSPSRKAACPFENRTEQNIA
jgi:hypothetical protein